MLCPSASAVPRQGCDGDLPHALEGVLFSHACHDGGPVHLLWAENVNDVEEKLLVGSVVPVDHVGGRCWSLWGVGEREVGFCCLGKLDAGCREEVLDGW